MTNREKRIYLIQSLQQEMPQYKELEIPKDEEEQRKLLRALMNLRPPMPAGDGFLKIQDEYLTEETIKRGVVEADVLPVSTLDERIALWRGDITRLQIDAIVNAANSGLLGCFQPCHSCIDNIIHTYAGVQLRLACQEIRQRQGQEEPVGNAKITRGYNLPCNYVLHTVGPMISGPLTSRDCELLANCYRSCLELAEEENLRSVAFCCISTGVFGFPQDRAAEIAVRTVTEYLKLHPGIRRVVFDVFTEWDEVLYRRLLMAEH